MNGPATSSTINAAITGVGAIDSEFVDSLGTAFGLPSTEVRTVLRSALRGTGTAAEGYEIRTGAWRLDLNAAIAKAAACGTVTTLILRGLSTDSIPATVLSVIAPLLFELERVEVSAGDLVVHAQLTEALGDDVVHLTEMYERLPCDIRDELSVREFVDTVERLRESRLVIVGPNGLRLSAPGGTRRFALYLR
jgi:hypothetical protein